MREVAEAVKVPMDPSDKPADEWATSLIEDAAPPRCYGRPFSGSAS
jgi:hypothetical protein